MKFGKKIVNNNTSRSLYLILLLLILFFIAINYNSLDKSLETLLTQNQEVRVERIIDGDTIEVFNENESIRLLGINTPERGEVFYAEAKDFLEAELLNETVTLEYVGERYDKYGRTLAYVIKGGENINAKIVKNGLANYYFYSGKDKYSDELLEAWNQCIKDEINLCERSTDKCRSCVNINSEGHSIINNCGFSCDIFGWQIKGEGREKFVFTQQSLQPEKSTNFVLDLSNTGGSIFLRDEEGKLVQWKE